MRRTDLLVLHGITMSGESMLRAIGPLRTRLEEAGLDLVAPNAAHAMSSDEVAGVVRWVTPMYEKLGQRAEDSFCDGRFWHDNEHFDWFGMRTDPKSGRRTYEAVEAGLDAIAQAIRHRPVRGVLGFSQGCAMAVIVASMAAAGDPRFAGIRYGVFLSGFKPEPDEPDIVTFPIAQSFRRFLLLGDRDPIMSTGRAGLDALAEAFEGETRDKVLLKGLGHELPTSPAVVDQIVSFASESARAED